MARALEPNGPMMQAKPPTVGGRAGRGDIGRRTSGDRSPAGLGPNFPATGRPDGGTLTHVQASGQSRLPGLLRGFEDGGGVGDLLSSAPALAGPSADPALPSVRTLQAHTSDCR